MSDEKKIEVWDCQEFIRTAPLKDVIEHIHWARGVIEMREMMEAKPKRVRRKYVGVPRDGQEELINLKEITK